MLTVSKDHPLLTTITGSLPRPHWFVENLQGRPFSLAMTDVAFREQYTDAVAAYLSDQTRAGLDLLTDGDARCDCDVGGRSWFAYPAERLEGLQGHHVGRGRTASSRDKAAGDIMFEVLETRVLPHVTGPVRRGPLEYARVWKVAQRLTRKPVKFGAISGQMIATGVNDRHYKDRRELIMALSTAMNAELNDLADAGCPVIQVEEPAIHGMVGVDDKEVTGDFLVEAFNAEVKGLRDKAEVWCHTCWGNPAAQRTETKRRFYTQALPFLRPARRRRRHVRGGGQRRRRDRELRPGHRRRQEDRHRRRQPPHPAGGAAGGGRRAHPARAQGHGAEAADRLDRLRLRAPGHEPAARLLQDRVARARRQHRAPRAGAARGGCLGRRSQGRAAGVNAIKQGALYLSPLAGREPAPDLIRGRIAKRSG